MYTLDSVLWGLSSKNGQQNETNKCLVPNDHFLPF